MGFGGTAQPLQIRPPACARQLGQTAGDTLGISFNASIPPAREISYIGFQRGYGIGRAPLCRDPIGIIVLMGEERRSFAQAFRDHFVKLTAWPATSTPARPCARRPSWRNRRSMRSRRSSRWTEGSTRRWPASTSRARTPRPDTWSRRACATSGARAWTATRTPAAVSRSSGTSWSGSGRSSGGHQGRRAPGGAGAGRAGGAARGLAPRPPGRRGRQRGGQHRQHRLRAVHDLRPGSERARSCGASTVSAAIPATSRRWAASSTGGRSWRGCSATRAGPRTSPRTR